MDSQVFSAHHWITVENLEQPVTLEMLSSAVVCFNRDRGKTETAKKDKTIRKETKKEEEKRSGPL